MDFYILGSQFASAPSTFTLALPFQLYLSKHLEGLQSKALT